MKPLQFVVILITMLPLSCILYGILYHLLVIAIAAPILYFGYTYVLHVFDMDKYPPGPFPLPIIGNLHLLGMSPHKSLTKLGETYGNVFSVSIGMERTVIVNKIEANREALITKGKSFAGRPSSYTIDLISRDGTNLAFTDYGQYWITMRKLGHSAVQMFGKGDILEGLLTEESGFLRDRLKKQDELPIDPTDDLGLAIINVICQMCFGHRYNEEDEEFRQIMKFCELIFQGIGASSAVSALPWLKFFPLDSLKKVEEGVAIKDPIIRRKVNKHIEAFDPTNLRDITDCMLKVRSEEKFSGKAEIQKVSDEQLEMIVNDIFIGGVETTLSSLTWALLYLIHWPEYQDMMYNEIISVCGPDDYPTLEKKSSLHIVQACIQETLRLSSLAPLSVPHKATQDDTINGLTIPKGTQVLSNIWSCHYDTRFWKNPEEFNPLQWLDENGEYHPLKNKSFLPFSAGRRNCFGEVIAKAELFVLYSRLVKDFRVEACPDEDLPSLDGVLGITLAPPTFKAIFKSR